MRPGLYVAAAMAMTTSSFVPSIGIAQNAERSFSQKPFQAKIIALNDYHGNLESPGRFGQNNQVPFADRPPVGGADYIAAYVERLKSQHRNAVVVGAGDFIGASPLISAAFHDEPSVETLNRIGLEFNAVGNHEFDRGVSELRRLQHGGCKFTNGSPDPNSCKGDQVGTPVPFEGAKFQWLSANVIEKSTGKTLFPAYGIKNFSGVKVAFVGMTLKATPTIVTPSGVAGLDFLDEAASVNALIPELRKQGIEAIVVLLHEGGSQTGTLADINGCEGGLAGSPLSRIVSQLDDRIDLVISGHSHSAYNCMLQNAVGRNISVTSASAFGRVLTDIDITLNPSTKDIVDVQATNRLVSRNDATLKVDPSLVKVIDGYKSLVSPVANAVIGSIQAALPNARSDGACNMPAGALIADAQLAATRVAGFGDARIAFMNGGGVRSPGFTFPQSAAGEGDGNVTYGEAFTVQPFGNSLVTMTLTAQELKNVLEEQFAGCRGQSPTATRIMLPSAGFKYTWDGAKSCDGRIANVSLVTDGATEVIVDATGKVLNPEKPYRVTVNSFMAEGGDGFSTFLQGRERLGGALDIDALVTFLSKYKAPNPSFSLDAVAEDGGTARIRRVSTSSSCPGGANTNP